MGKLKLSALNVGQRLLLLTVFPLLVVTSLLTSYMVITRQADREDVLFERGDSMVRHLAGAAEFGLFAGDFATLKQLADTMLEQDDVLVIRFFDAKGGLLLAAGDNNTDAGVIRSRMDTIVERNDLLWLFQTAVYYTELNVDEFDVAAAAVYANGPALLGWVQLVMDGQRMRLEQQFILAKSLMIAVLGFVILFLLARCVAKSISRPMSELTQTVRLLERGSLSERSKITGEGELGELAQGINNLAASVEAFNTEQKSRIEEATQQLTDALGALERRNSQLELTRENLLDANAVKDDFLARMSHELRTPLTAISGYGKLLQAMPLNDNQEEYLRNIIEASKILLSTIEDILDFARLESGVVCIEELPFFLEDTLEDVLALHALVAQQKQLELVLLIESDVPLHLQGDALRLRQILTNLVSNALKFTDEGQVVLGVKLESLSDNVTALCFSVQDSGIGISEPHQEQLFDAFSQADQTISRRFGGTGLGLAIVKELTQLMGGDVRIASQLGKGTEVSFTISYELTKPFVDGSESRTSADIGRIAKLYIYDKNTWARRFLRNIGVAMFSDVFVCENQQNLLVKLESSESSADVLILGLGPKELASRQPSRLLASVRENFSGPIVLLAGVDVTALDALEDECAPFGQVYVRSKPIRRSKLQQLLRLTPTYKENIKQRMAADFSSVSAGERLAKAQILIAEDNDFNRNLICAIVEAEGGVAIGVKDGVEALREVHASKIDLALVDLNMPRLGGRLVVQELRRSDVAIAKIPVVALTAEVLEGDDPKLLEEGFDQVLFKPLDEAQLIDTIVGLLVGKSREESKQVNINSAQQSFLSVLSVDLLDEEVARQLRLLAAAHDEEDMDTMCHQIHQLRSVLYGVADSDEIVAQARQLELACGRGDLEAVAEGFLMLKEKLSQPLG